MLASASSSGRWQGWSDPSADGSADPLADDSPDDEPRLPRLPRGWLARAPGRLPRGWSRLRRRFRMRTRRLRPELSDDTPNTDGLENYIKNDVIDHLANEHVKIDKDWLDYWTDTVKGWPDNRLGSGGDQTSLPHNFFTT